MWLILGNLGCGAQARSVLEGRDVGTPAAHIAQAIAGHGSLAGLMFSGCTDDDGAGNYTQREEEGGGDKERERETTTTAR